ncbi:glutamine ABC transporter permease, partial [Streptococcus pneumoniae]
MKKLYRIHFIAIAVIDLLLFAFFIPNHSYL